MVDNPIFSEEEIEIISIGLRDSKEFLGGEEHEILDSACESQLNLLRAICDPYIARHKMAMEAKAVSLNRKPNRTECNSQDNRDILVKYIFGLKTMLSDLGDEQVDLVYGAILEVDDWLSMVARDEKITKADFVEQLDRLQTICDPVMQQNADQRRIPHHSGPFGLGGAGQEIKKLREEERRLPFDSPDRVQVLMRLADIFLMPFMQLGEPTDAEEALKWCSELVEVTSQQDPLRPRRLANVGALLSSRFKNSGRMEDGDNAIKSLQEAINLSSYNNPLRSSFLKNLGVVLHCRFQYFGNNEDLDKAIETLRESVSTTSSRHPERADRLYTLALALDTRAENFGPVDVIQETISCLREAVQLTPYNSPNSSVYLNRLGLSFRLRYRSLKEDKDAKEAIENLRQAVQATAYNISHRLICLHDLGVACLDRFNDSHVREYIDEAIDRLSEVEKHTPHNSPLRIEVVNTLGKSFQSRFLRFGGAEDVEASIKWLEEAVKGTPRHHPDRPIRLNNLSASLIRRFQQYARIKDNEDAITTLSEAIELTSTSPDGPQQATFLHNLGNAFRNQFEHSNSIDDINKSIETLRGSVKLTPHSHPLRDIRLSVLCLSLFDRSRDVDDTNDIEEAIELQQEAVKLTPNDSPERAARLVNLTTLLKRRFWRSRAAKDIDKAIELVRRALDSTPHESPDRPTYLDDLSDSFHLRFKRFGVASDNEEAVVTARESIRLTTNDSPRLLGRLHDLSTLCQFRFTRLADINDIEEAIQLSRRVVTSTVQVHSNPKAPSRSGCLETLAMALMYRFSRFQMVMDINEAIELLREAVKLGQDSGHLNSLGFQLHVRFLHFEIIEDIHESIQVLRQAEGEMSANHVNRSKLQFNIGMALLSRYEHNADTQDYHDAIAALRSSAMLVAGSPAGRFDASCSWARAAHTAKEFASALEGYTQAIDLLAQVVWVGLSVSARLDWLSKIQALACDAAACAFELSVIELELQQHYLGRAVELLDRGRSLLWSQMSNMKSDLGDLNKDHPTLAKALTEIGQALDQGSFRTSNQAPVTEEEGQLHRRRAEEWEELVTHIRQLPGYNHFLLSPGISELRKAAAGGSIVIINISTYRCDAAIVRIDDDLVFVPLPSVTAEKLNILAKGLSEKVRAFETNTDPGSFHDDLKNNLYDTWTLLGYPIISKLELPIHPLPRIWWCLTGLLTFIPIHASLPRPVSRVRRGKRATGMMDRVISSYTPTLSALLRAKRRQNIPPLRMLAVGVPEEIPPYPPLPSVANEMEIICSLLPAPQLQLLVGKNATVESVSNALKSCTWAHFGCHGIEDSMEPMDSFLVMSNGRLTLSTIARGSLNQAEFAYLSACQTARGPMHLPDEAIHLAAGLQYAGFRGIVGTLWSIADDTAQTMTKKVYTELFKNDTTSQSNAEEAARALNEAVRHLRDEAQVPLSQWVPFIHIGL